jgi:hypothetical protein
MPKKRRNSPPAPKQTDKKGKTAYPFLENSDEREVTIFTILMVTKPQKCNG